MALIDDAKRPEPNRTPLKENPRRRYGPQKAKLVPCSTKPNVRSFPPEDENCPECLGWHETLAHVAIDGLDEPFGYGYDSDGYYWP